MFLGEYQHSLDAKGRIIIPARFREQLGECFIATRGLDNCIFVYPPEEWHNIEEKMRSLPFTRADVRSFMRIFLSGASELELDKQGRTVLPANLRDYAHINKDIIIIGVGTRVEIWSAENWETYTMNSSSSYEQIAESLVDLGI
ncbi:division/cell wall cluster transcriptional repressor MraZ [Syntrophomonas palmitatica]|uniref:division/cell wall cluster transcriptional repressor MraZ n=1 Tax=Syntrophomonas palmitatica TaxID=402877 RepID=UPI0006D002F6|nr:division/cell wall cluster transcriptional repressor MraZ [Syntrophomonas palmitatica]